MGNIREYARKVVPTDKKEESQGSGHNRSYKKSNTMLVENEEFKNTSLNASGNDFFNKSFNEDNKLNLSNKNLSLSKSEEKIDTSWVSKGSKNMIEDQVDELVDE